MSGRNLEKKIEQTAVQKAEARGWWQIKLVSPSKNGVPDRLFAKAGKVVFIEFKRPGEEPTAQQKLRHAEMRAAGLTVVVCDTVEDALRVLT